MTAFSVDLSQYLLLQDVLKVGKVSKLFSSNKYSVHKNQNFVAKTKTIAKGKVKEIDVAGIHTALE